MTPLSKDSYLQGLESLFKALGGHGAQPLEPGDPFYVEILERKGSHDPIAALHTSISWAESESVHLLTGFRGNGKSTQLRRLKRALESSGCTVFLVDMLRFVLLTKPIALSDFLLSLMAALADAIGTEATTRSLANSYWERLTRLLQAEVKIEGLDFDLGVARIGTKLQTDASFKDRVQRHLRGHVTRLVEESRTFVSEIVSTVREKNEHTKVVLLVDSMEQLRGPSVVGIGEPKESDAWKVYSSAVELFSGQASNLQFPRLHVVYSVPPYLTSLAPNVTRNFGGNPLVVWPNVHVRARGGAPDDEGLGIMRELVERRYPEWSGVIDRRELNQAATSTGGDIRDFFRLLRDGASRARSARLADPTSRYDSKVMDQSEQSLRNDFGFLSEEDLKWLRQIHASKSPALDSNDRVIALARFFDSNLIMNYVNGGDPWYDVHPLALPKASERGGRRPAARKR